MPPARVLALHVKRFGSDFRKFCDLPAFPGRTVDPSAKSAAAASVQGLNRDRAEEGGRPEMSWT